MFLAQGPCEVVLLHTFNIKKDIGGHETLTETLDVGTLQTLDPESRHVRVFSNICIQAEVTLSDSYYITWWCSTSPSCSAC